MGGNREEKRGGGYRRGYHGGGGRHLQLPSVSLVRLQVRADKGEGGAANDEGEAHAPAELVDAARRPKRETERLARPLAETVDAGGTLLTRSGEHDVVKEAVCAVGGSPQEDVDCEATRRRSREGVRGVGKVAAMRKSRIKVAADMTHTQGGGAETCTIPV